MRTCKFVIFIQISQQDKDSYDVHKLFYFVFISYQFIVVEKNLATYGNGMNVVKQNQSWQVYIL